MSIARADDWYPERPSLYIAPNEIAVDNALAKGDFSGAARYANAIIGRSVEYPENTMPNDLFHVLVKKTALPSYRRVYNYFYSNFDAFSDTALASEVEAVYGNTIDLLEKIRRTIAESQPSYEDGQRYTGFASELTAMALVNRGNNGTADDLYDILPASRLSDRGTKPGPDNIRDGFDYMLIDYEGENDQYLQIKTSRTPDKVYSAAILVIVMTEIAGGSVADLRELQAALIAECNGQATDEQVAHIEQSTERLYTILSGTASRT